MASSAAVSLPVVARWSVVVMSCVLLLARGQPSHSAARNHFNDTLFIVKYNFNVTAATAHNHFRMWRRVFPNQLIYVPWSEDQILKAKAPLWGHPSAQLISTIDDTPGYYAYTVVVDAMIKHPTYGRYLFALDDMAMNVSALMEIDRKLAVFATVDEKYDTYECKSWQTW
jgi:hypothetical protein